MISRHAAATIIGTSPLNEIPSSPSRISATDSMMTKKISEQGRQLAGERNDRVAARAGEPGAHAAPAELGADRVAGGERDDHMGDHRQQRAQQELRVVPLRIDQHDRLGDERPDAGRFWCRAGRGRRAGGGARLSLRPDAATPAAVRNCWL